MAGGDVVTFHNGMELLQRSWFTEPAAPQAKAPGFLDGRKPPADIFFPGAAGRFHPSLTAPKLLAFVPGLGIGHYRCTGCPEGPML